MSTDLKYSVLSNNSEETESLGVRLGRNFRGGEVIELISDVGGGKTTLVRGIATGAVSKNQVSSPTFTLSKVYECKNFDIHHFDFYRLAEPGIVKMELSELVRDDKIVIIVEWANTVEDALGDNVIKIQIEKDSTNESTRTITLNYPESMAYVAEGLR